MIIKQGKKRGKFRKGGNTHLNGRRLHHCSEGYSTERKRGDLLTLTCHTCQQKRDSFKVLDLLYFMMVC